MAKRKQTAISPVLLADEADRLNTLHSVGSTCRYWLGKREGPGKASRTRSRFEVIGGHSVMVWLEGTAGAIASTHVEFP
jgi:hypothetical protein